MAASSSSFSSSQISYDVFVCFRGPDVRCGFLSHLLNAFHEKGIRIDAYVDERLQKGEEVSPALLRAIEKSQISLIIFSPNYASSKWCLDELVKIIECTEQISQIVMPVFYQIEPSDVRHQTGNYGIPFAEHEKRYDIIRVQNWKAASKKAANLSGFPLSNFKSEATFIQEIVKCVVKNLDNNRIQKYYKKFVGLDRRIADVELLLRRGSKEVCIVGIWGPGGIGKSTIAEALFSKLFFEYKDRCCVINLREELGKNKIIDIKMKLCSQLLKENFDEISVTLALPSYVVRRLQRMKALILLDDVYELEHLKILIHEGKDLFGQGSIIIVTSRDKQVLRNIAGDNIYEVEALNDDETLQLFSLNAFKQENPEKDWIGLSKRAMRYAHGNPLALTVLGSLLFELKPKEWESQLKRLGKMPCKGIQKVIRLSYDRLDPDHKRIFLFLACFFCFERHSNIESLLDACGFSTLCGLKILENKALIKIAKDHVWMHNLIQEMGQEVVREESCDELGKRSHLWDAYDIYQVLMNDTGSKAIQSIVLNMSSQMHLRLKPYVFEKMINLKLLKFYGKKGQCTFHFPEGLESLPNELRLLHWEGYPLKSLPSTFGAENLVELNMPHSEVEKLWDGVQHLVNIKEIDLSGSKHLVGLPDLSKASKLELIDLSNCWSLVEVHESLFSLHQLEELYLSGCKKLKSLKSNIYSKSLRHLELDGCESLEDFSVISEPMEYLSVRGCKNLRYLPKELSELRSIQELNLKDCINLEPSSLCILLNCSVSLSCLSLNNCYKLGELPKNVPLSFKHFSRLTYLYLSNCWKLQCISSLPPSIRWLLIYNCGRLRSVVGLPTSIEYLNAQSCESLETVTSFASMLIFQSLFDISSKCSRLSYRNCINLDEDAINNILVFVHYKIKQFSYRFYGEKSDYRKTVEVFLPGWKVPDWFRHRARGASITIPLDISAESMCMGFICCIVLSNFQSNETYHDSFWEFRFYIEASEGQRVYNYSDPAVFIVEKQKGFQLVSDHMYLGYHLKSFSDVLEMRANNQSRTYEKRVSLRFDVPHVKGQPYPMIRECGVHPIYASEYFNSEELMYLKKYNWRFLTESLESKSGSNLLPRHKTLVPRVTKPWKNETGGLKQVLEF